MQSSSLILEFAQVARIANLDLNGSDLYFEDNPAPHLSQKPIPKGAMAVYVFRYGDHILKVGKAGPKSQARFTSQHYNAISAPSTLAASLIKHGQIVGIPELTVESAGAWMRQNLSRTNFIISSRLGPFALNLLEAFLQCKLQPKFEGFASQRL